jgi:hypothetical protein
VAEGPPEDIVIHARRWQKQAKHAAAADALLRSHTGEALDAFGATHLGGRAAGRPIA